MVTRAVGKPSTSPSRSASPPSPSPSGTNSYALSFIWKKHQLGVSLDTVLRNGTRSPLTVFYFWPETDAWESLKEELEKRQIPSQEKISLLNTLTRVTNFWQSSDSAPSVKEARQMFPQAVFSE